MSTQFLLQQSMLERTGQSDLPEVLRAAGIRFHLVESLDSCRVVADQDVPQVLYGAIKWVVDANKQLSLIPGMYYDDKRFNCSDYMRRLPLEIVANGDGVYMPFGDFRRRVDQVMNLFQVDELFLRPDGGSKTFTGFTITRENAAFEISSLDQLTGVVDGTMILVAPAKTISAEYRFWIVNRKVVTGSQYRVQGRDETSQHVDPACLTIAERVATLPYQPDVAYTCDVAMIGQTPMVIELNAMSTSGLYECDRAVLFQTLAVAAKLEYDGILSREG
ncbi:hypothetical protein HNP46_005729 [Pseudomonas nitritireducens]|uniref:ATP-grasp domain-containing protein n=1 Tax=Pseudomonas nitroreducens TaxID=46680 RepID=A0A7W7KQ36_PSENT|nr:ATP-grasp domain-containing protein [Pseudomonas nitritireducens]MBB4866822.1 hypothetical protein [Pseudomonas nitritireducens]